MHEVDRTRRVAELIKREMAVIIPRELNDDRINSVTVTAVTISRDLKQATIYISTVDASTDPGTVEKLINRSSGYLRRILSKQLNMRTTPALVFKYDESIDRGVRMTQLIDRLNTDNGS